MIFFLKHFQIIYLKWEEKSKLSVIQVIEEKLNKKLELNEKDSQALKGATEVIFLFKIIFNKRKIDRYCVFWP